VDTDYAGPGSASSAIEVAVEVDGKASRDALRALVDEVERIAETPRSLREGTEVTLTRRVLNGEAG
jgi:hypothetical protein